MAGTVKEGGPTAYVLPKTKPPQLPQPGPRPTKRKRHMLGPPEQADILGLELRLQPERLPPNANGETYDVELLVSHRIIGDSGEEESTEYLVMWAGDWPLAQRYTWEPEENIDAVNLVGSYWREWCKRVTAREF